MLAASIFVSLPALSSGPGRSLLSRRRMLRLCPAAFGWEYGGGRLVDENMIVLRKRIHEMRMAETNCEAPAKWADWEKRYYTAYHADVCDFLCRLQAILVRTRPSLVIAVAAALAVGLPTAALLLSCHLIAAAEALLAGIHLL